MPAEKAKDRRVHMANERTFLAWIRTSIAIMAFGFVVEKFGLFVRQFAYFLSQSETAQSKALPSAVSPSPGYSSLLGVLLVALGAVMSVLAFVRYKNVERQIDEDRYQPSRVLDLLLVLSILAIAAFLILYLVHSI
ncbi:MAG: DUF202 domain-containing protein [Nitrospirae bacterium]|nr:DUF202 domain-containing protein [Nitrospirota bacterium]